MIGSFAASVLGIASHPAANDASVAGNLAAGIIRPERRFKLIVEPFSIAFDGLRQRVAVILRLIKGGISVKVSTGPAQRKKGTQKRPCKHLFFARSENIFNQI